MRPSEGLVATLITGAGGGIGLATARAFAEAGASVHSCRSSGGNGRSAWIPAPRRRAPGVDGSSIGGMRGSKGRAAYSASKSGVIGLTRAAAQNPHSD